MMKGKLIIDGNAIYEIDEECMNYLKNKKTTKNDLAVESKKSKKQKRDDK